MRSHLVINNKDFTDHIVPDTYEVGAEDIYESWNDGNMREHRIIIAKKVRGSLQIRCSEGTLPLSDFLADVRAATVNGVLTLGLYVTTMDSFEALECYYHIESSDHIKDTGGKLYDVLTLNLTER